MYNAHINHKMRLNMTKYVSRLKNLSSTLNRLASLGYTVEKQDFCLNGRKCWSINGTVMTDKQIVIEHPVAVQI